MDPIESLVIRQLQAGREEGYKYLFDHHYQVLCLLASRYVHDDFLAESIVGDVIFHLWETRSSLNITTSLRSYLVRCVRNKCLDYLGSRRVRTESVGLEGSPDLPGSETPAEPLGRLLELELEDQVAQSIGRLPEQCSKVFRMSRFEGKKYDEIAASLGISAETVKYHIKHALALLREDLGRYLIPVILLLLGLPE